MNSKQEVHIQRVKKVGLTNKAKACYTLSHNQGESSMTTKINIYEAKKNLSKLIDEAVLGGEEVIICKYGTPMVALVPVEKGVVRPQEGFAKEYFDAIGFELPDNFDTMMQDEIVEMFEGEHNETTL